MGEINKIGSFISEKRKEKGMTQSQLAERLGVTDKAVSKWERGIGYPDIMLVISLADALGITATELLNGCEDPNKTQPDESHIIQSTLDYAGIAMRSKKEQRLRLAFNIVSVSLAAAALICTIVEIIVTLQLHWSLLTATSFLFAWLIMYPVFSFKKNKLTFAIVSASLFLLPYLFVLSVSIDGDWFLNIAVPGSAAILVFVWICYSLFAFTKINAWFCGAITVLFAPFVMLLMQKLISAHTAYPFDYPFGISLAICVLVAALFIALGLWKRS